MDIFIIVIVIVGGSASQYVQLFAPRYITKNQGILLNCTSLKAPVGEYAEFLVNGKTYTSLQKHNFHCVVGNENINCGKNNCQCSNNSLWYSLLYTGYTNVKKINFKCVMIYDDVGKQSDEICTTILDIKGPIMSSNKIFPLVAGIEVEMKCSVSVMDIEVQIVWDCWNFSTIQNKYHTPEYISTLTFIPSSILNGIICKCLVEVEDFVSIANTTLEVTNEPFLKLNENIICNSAQSTVISCEILGELSKHGFYRWIHSLNGEKIREINGTVVGNGSFLVLNSCGYRDVGSYSCRAWNNYRGQMFLANRTTNVEVVGKPVILKTYIRNKLSIRLVVAFYSNPKASNVQWYLRDKPVFNSTNYALDVFETKVELVIFDKRVHFEGYVNNITLPEPISGMYTVMIENEYGITKGELELTIKGSTYNITIIFWILTGVAVFLLTATISTLFARRNHRSDFATDNRAAIYHAAPVIENQMSIYDIPGNQYEECEDIEVGSDYLQVLSSSCSENGDQYEEVQ